MYLQNKAYQGLNVAFDELNRLLFELNFAFHEHRTHFDMLRNNTPKAAK